MDAKDLRTEAALGDRSNDGNTKYAQSTGTLSCHRNKTYQDIGSNSLGKVDAPNARPCAVIGPDRVVPPPASTDAYVKKGPTEPWLAPENTYRRPPEYPHKVLDYQHPTRNISPRQTFQENMQRIMVPPSYNSVKMKDDLNFSEVNITQMRNTKLNVPTDSTAKYCDVPYNVNPMINEQKNVRNSDISVSNMNNVLTRSVPHAPHGWPPANANVRASKPFPQEVYQYPEYPSCAGPRPVLMSRPHRTLHEEPAAVYSDAYYHDGNIRFKPYPPVKERYPQSRYEYIGNYANPYHPPPPFPAHKYDLQKPMPGHPYPGYSQVPLKYLDGRMAEPIMNGYQRPLNPQGSYNNLPFRNQVIHPTYGPIPGNCLPSNKFYPYPPDGSKTIAANKLPYDANSKVYTEFDNTRNKSYPMHDGFYVNEIPRTHSMKGQVLPPNYPTNVHAMPQHAYYRKDNILIKGYEYNSHYRNIDPNLNVNGNPLLRFSTEFSSNAIAMSPSDSNTSNDTSQTHGTSQEDCGYVSQSSTASVRSMDSNISRMHHDVYRRYDQRYGPLMKSSPLLPKHDRNSHVYNNSKEKKDIDVRQFLQMWNEGEDEGSENAKEVIIKTNNTNNNANHYENNNQEQLYVLGLVNVPSEELGKYEHIQKVSKLPENIKGYSSIELLHQFEEVIESSNLNNYNAKPPTSREFRGPVKGNMPMHSIAIPPRPISPLDVEAKISQSVIHKEVGCNFEIKPCSPKMLNVEVATPVQNVLAERAIEKVSNPLIINSPLLPTLEENGNNCNVIKCQDRTSVNETSKVASCKMVNTQYSHSDLNDSVKTNYSLQDLESNSGVCLASLPRLDNDIELNFPEVNQQFINANKVESVITAAPLKDLLPLDIDQSDTTKGDGIESEIGSSINVSVEKDFSKLSKYRKLKRKGTEANTSETNVQALRTDSVIIKNPDNNKSMEQSVEKTTLSKNKPANAQDDPINLSVNTENRGNTNKSDFETKKLQVGKSNDFAIDFSLNSNEHIESKSNIQVSENNTNIKSNYPDDKPFNLQFEEYSPKNKKTNFCEDICSIFQHPDDITKYDENQQNFESNDITNNKDSFDVPNLDVTETIKESLDIEMSDSKSDHGAIHHLQNEEKTNETSIRSGTPERENNEINQVDTIFEEDPEPALNFNLAPNIQYTTNDGSNNCNTNIDKSCTLFDSSFAHVEAQLTSKDENRNSRTNDTKILEKTDEPAKNSALDADIMPEQQVVEILPGQQQDEKIREKTPCNADIFNETLSNHARLRHSNTKYHIHKELWCPFIQKLIMKNEGLCTSPTNNFHNLDETEMGKISVSRTSNDNESRKSIDKESYCDLSFEAVSEQTEDVSLVDKTSHNLNNAPCNVSETDAGVLSPLSLDEESVTDSENSKQSDMSIYDTEKKTSVTRTDISTESNIKNKHANRFSSESIDSHANIETDTDSIDIKTIMSDNLLPHSCLDTEILDSSIGEAKVERIVNITKIEEKACQHVNNDCHFAKDRVSLQVNAFTDNLDEKKLEQKTEMTYMEPISSISKTQDVSPVHEPLFGDIPDKSLQFKEIGETQPLSDHLNSLQHDTLTETVNDDHEELTEQSNDLSSQPNSPSSSLGNSVLQEHLNELSYDNSASNAFFPKKIHCPLTLTNECRGEYIEDMISPDDCALPEANVVKIRRENVEIDYIENPHCDDNKIANNNDHLSELTTEKISISTDFENLNQFVSDVDTDIIDEAIPQSTHNKSRINAVASTDNIFDLDTLQDSTVEMSHNQTIICEQQFKESTKLDKIPPYDSNKVLRCRPSYSSNKLKSLKRSLSDSALDEIRDHTKDDTESAALLLPAYKRKKYVEPKSYVDPQLISESYCAQSNRRNSISIIQNDDNVSFCILIDDNCIITEESEETAKICFTEIPEDCLTCVDDVSINEEGDSRSELKTQQEEFNYEESTPLDDHFSQEEKSLEEPWVDDIACVETVVSDDIAENIVISASTSPKDTDLSDGDYEDETEYYNMNEHTDKLKYIYGDKMCNDDAQFVETLYRTPQMNVNRTLINRESHNIEDCSRYYDKESLERVLSESNTHEEPAGIVDDVEPYVDNASSVDIKQSPDNKENLNLASFNIYSMETLNDYHENNVNTVSNLDMYEIKDGQNNLKNHKEPKENVVSPCESSIDNVFTYKNCTESAKCTISSSPEVSSTTSEDKSSGILLKITNFGGSRISQVNDVKVNPGNKISCKYTEKKDYLSTNSNLPTRTLLTKAAQKYIPPIKESIPDLKVKLALPQHSLIKLKQLKLAKESPKQNVGKPNNVFRKDVPKKLKPKFEDVLKSIDEIQFQMHKEKTKKIKKSIPKVVIKKSENGSHYASTSNKDKFNPDLTGCKWQPWVFIEKSPFIDKMALKNKTRAVFSHRKNIYVLAEKFQKYKSVGSGKFIISQPKLNDSSSGQLKYTIRLKHSY